MNGLKVVPIGVSDLRDAPEILRNIAARMEAGDYGEVLTAVVVIFSEDGARRVSVHGMGRESSAAEASVVLALGQRHLEQMWTESPVGRFEPAA